MDIPNLKLLILKRFDKEITCINRFFYHKARGTIYQGYLKHIYTDYIINKASFVPQVI